MLNDRMVSATVVATWSMWAAAVILIAVGCSIGLAHYNAEWARTTGVVLALGGVLFMGAAAVLSIKLIADKRTRQVLDAIELHSDVKDRLQSVDD